MLSSQKPMMSMMPRLRQVHMALFAAILLSACFFLVLQQGRAKDAPATASSPTQLAESPAVRTYLDRAETCAAKNQVHQIVAYANKALACDSRAGRAYLVKGYALYKLEDSAEAAKTIEHGLNLLPNFGKGIPIFHTVDCGSPYHFWVNALYEAGKKNEAIAAVEKCLPYEDSKLALYDDRGSIYAENKQYDKAILDFTRQIELSAKDHNGYLNRGRMYLHVNQPGKAIADFKRALQISPKEGLIHRCCGDAYKMNGQAELASKEYAISERLGAQTEFNY